MNKDVKTTAKQLRQAVCGDMEKLLDEVTGAVNTAPDGAVNSSSKEAVRDDSVTATAPNILTVLDEEAASRRSSGENAR